MMQLMSYKQFYGYIFIRVVSGENYFWAAVPPVATGPDWKQSWATPSRAWFSHLLAKTLCRWKVPFYLTKIPCVIRGKIQMGSKKYLSLSIHFEQSFFFWNKVPWGKAEGARY